jgi:hypothetical protein
MLRSEFSTIISKMDLKRKPTEITLAQKYEAVKLLEEKIPQTEVCKKLGISQLQVCSISKKR